MNSQNPQNNLRNAFGSFTTGVTIVSACKNQQMRGFTANSFASVSLSPALVSVCLETTAQCMDVFKDCANFAISILTSEQKAVAHHFAYFQGDRFASTEHFMSKLGSPIIENSLAWFDCICEQRILLGDHIMLIGKIEDFSYDDKSPLVYFRGDYRS